MIKNLLIRLLIGMLYSILCFGCIPQQSNIIYIEYDVDSYQGWDDSAFRTLQRACFLKAMLDYYGDNRFYEYVRKIFTERIIKSDKGAYPLIFKQDLSIIVLEEIHGQIVNWNHIVYPTSEQLTCTANSNTKRLLADNDYLKNLLNSYKKQMIFERCPPGSVLKTEKDSLQYYYTEAMHTYYMYLHPLFKPSLPPFNQINMRDTFYTKSKKDFMIWYRNVLDSMLRIPVKYRYSLDGPTYDSRERPLFKSKKTKK